MQPAKVPHAQMAELVDALDSKSGIRKDVQVRFLFWARKKLSNIGGLFYVIIYSPSKNLYMLKI